MKVFLPGGAGLVGLNLIAKIIDQHPDWELLIVDKKLASVEIGRNLFPNVQFLCEDLTFLGEQSWPKKILNYDCCVFLQAEIGNLDKNKFELNNVLSTKLIVEVIKKSKIKRIVHISSSVINSIVNDHYTFTKLKQEEIVLKNYPDAIILRPTLMFGWFDRKHMGWLSRFMKKSPLFPIRGKGNFKRQPLYVGDFCSIIIRSLEEVSLKGVYDITGLEQIRYVDLMRSIRSYARCKVIFIYLPIYLFNFLLKIWSLLSSNPAFTSSQLKALVAGDEFEVINWPSIFSIEPTRLEDALRITYQDNRYSKIFIPF